MYHTACWSDQPIHHITPLHSHTSVEDITRLRYFCAPNKSVSIENEAEKDVLNCFIEYVVESSQFELGPRAFPLLPERNILQHPSFVSFVGRTGHGKSFLLRALQYCSDENVCTPIPAPGAKVNHSSTSSDIHLYQDFETADTKSPILFLDCEGFEGSDTPSTWVHRFKNFSHTPEQMRTRRERVQNAYPRLLYLFSTCIVFVTSESPSSSAEIARKLIRYASRGASGSRNQGFTPTLFVVFNRFRSGHNPEFDWRTESSTSMFLRQEELVKLKQYYDTIHVIYIPEVGATDSSIALSQITTFKALLRKEHKKAFQRRQEFRLVFTPVQLKQFLWRALDLLSHDSLAIFDWSGEISYQDFESCTGMAIFRDLWNQISTYCCSPHISAIEHYRRTRKAFTEHVSFCLLLELNRRPPPGEHEKTLPRPLKNLITQIDQLILGYSPCAASRSLFGVVTVKCIELQYRHAHYHQGVATFLVSYSSRWDGNHEKVEDFPTFQEIFNNHLSKRRSPSQVSLRAFPGVNPSKTSVLPNADATEILVLQRNIYSATSCLGCLRGPPSTMLACGHAFCLECVRELDSAADSSHHLTQALLCPFHRSPQHFGPRLLPSGAGYRVLALDGGGVKGLAQLVILAHIETRCCGIPAAQLFDLIVGTSIGGLIPLAFVAPKQLTVAQALAEFETMMVRSFVGSTFRRTQIMTWLFDSPKYATGPLEKQLKVIFGQHTKLFGTFAPHTPKNVPNVAVTTVSLDSFELRLVAN
jgi:hypothetical protein